MLVHDASVLHCDVTSAPYSTPTTNTTTMRPRTRQRRRCSATATTLGTVHGTVKTVFLLATVHCLPTSEAWKLKQPWTTRNWCLEVDNARWPFAYAKEVGDTEEGKGMSASNDQVPYTQSHAFDCQVFMSPVVVTDKFFSRLCLFEVPGS